jgi:hypothetical protein
MIGPEDCASRSSARRSPGNPLLGRIEAERAFDRAARARRRALLIGRLRGRCTGCGRLAIHDERTPRRSGWVPALVSERSRSMRSAVPSSPAEPRRSTTTSDPPRRLARGGSACGSPRTVRRCCRRSPSSRSATCTQPATAITASPSPSARRPHDHRDVNADEDLLSRRAAECWLRRPKRRKPRRGIQGALLGGARTEDRSVPARVVVSDRRLRCLARIRRAHEGRRHDAGTPML